MSRKFVADSLIVIFRTKAEFKAAEESLGAEPCIDFIDIRITKSPDQYLCSQGTCLCDFAFETLMYYHSDFPPDFQRRKRCHDSCLPFAYVERMNLVRFYLDNVVGKQL